MDEAAKNIQENLQISLKQEISAMREMLANMHQEELSLIACDRKAWTQVMMDRVSLLSRLSELRSIRLSCTQQLELTTSLSDLDCELISMRDQLTSLIEKMNQQQHRIQNLEAHPSLGIFKYPPQKPQEGGKKPGAIATYVKDE